MEKYEWLSINYTLPKEPSRARVSVWRKLKKSGAAITGQSVWMLPANENNEDFFRRVSDEITQNGGEAYIARSTSIDERTESNIIAAFNGARDEEYSELIEKCEDMLRELEKESVNCKFTFAELEENEEEFQKLDDWHQKIKGRDFYGSSLKILSDEKLEQCRVQLDIFSEEVYRRNNQEE